MRFPHFHLSAHLSMSSLNVVFFKIIFHKIKSFYAIAWFMVPYCLSLLSSNHFAIVSNLMSWFPINVCLLDSFVAHTISFFPFQCWLFGRTLISRSIVHHPFVFRLSFIITTSEQTSNSQSVETDSVRTDSLFSSH